MFNTCPDAGTARRIATALVERRLAACVNIIAGVQSVYRWQDKVETGNEHLLVIKCSSDAYAALEQAVTELHPDELPEIVAVSIKAGLPGFLDWINNNSRQP